MNDPAFRIRTTPEDFRVVEEPLYPATGQGDHTFVFVEKRGRTTEQVARELARMAALPARDVGYAGRKDRYAVTRQWFSLEGVAPERVRGFELPDARVLEARAHPHKLRTGQLRANRFEIVLRTDSRVDLAPLEVRAETLRRRGLPNRYGDQRFGRDGDNAERARQLLASNRPPRDRRAARFLVSALQAELFNAVLEARGDDYDSVRPGDLARVEASGGLFWVDDLAREQDRAARFEISATGPIVGPKMRRPRDEVDALERTIYRRYGLPDPEALRWPRGLRARGTRRPLRVRPEALRLSPLGDGPGLLLSCALPPGAYVTVLLDAILPGKIVDVSRPVASSDTANPRAVSSSRHSRRERGSNGQVDATRPGCERARQTGSEST